MDHYCECYCGGCACCPDNYEAPKPVDYNAISPEQAAEMIKALPKGNGPFGPPGMGKSHLSALMDRRDGREIVTVELPDMAPEDLSGLPVRV